MYIFTVLRLDTIFEDCDTLNADSRHQLALHKHSHIHNDQLYFWCGVCVCVFRVNIVNNVETPDFNNSFRMFGIFSGVDRYPILNTKSLIPLHLTSMKVSIEFISIVKTFSNALFYSFRFFLSLCSRALSLSFQM